MTRKTVLQGSAKVIVHGSAVAIDGAAVLLRGTSGAGKSDLAFRLLGAGGGLISDDQVELERRQDKVFAGCIESIKGLLEVRGVGLLRYPVVLSAQLRLIVDLVAREDVPRLPDWEEEDILGVALPRIRLYAFEPSAPLKVVKAMEAAARPDILVK
jgi:HPr kinase/phosphorylase